MHALTQQAPSRPESLNLRQAFCSSGHMLGSEAREKMERSQWERPRDGPSFASRPARLFPDSSIWKACGMGEVIRTLSVVCLHGVNLKEPGLDLVQDGRLGRV